MAKDKKVLKRIEESAAAALQKAGGPVKQDKLTGKVFKKVHSKYAEVTEQQVTALLQQLLQTNSKFRLEGHKVVLNAPEPGQQPPVPPATVAQAPAVPPAAAPAAAAPAAATSSSQLQGDSEHKEKHKRHKKQDKKKRDREQQQAVAPAAAAAGAGVDGQQQQQQQQQRKKQKQSHKENAQQQASLEQQAAPKHAQQQQQQAQAAPAAAAGARVNRLGAPPTPVAAAADGDTSNGAAAAPLEVAPAGPAAAAAAPAAAAAQGVAAKFAKHLKTGSSAAAAAAGGGGSSEAKPKAKPKPRARKQKAPPPAAAADGGAAAVLLPDLNGETWREDFNRTDLKHGPYEPHEVKEVQDHVTAFAAPRGLPDQPGTCDWLMDLKAHQITQGQLTADIYRPCLPHRSCKSVWQYVHRVYPPYKWGPWTEEEDTQLRELQAAKGNKWKEIGLVLGRHSESVVDRWKNLNAAQKKGRWTPEEEAQLKAVVAEFKSKAEEVPLRRNISENLLSSVTEVPRLMGTVPRDDIDWTFVAKYMEGRSAKQCVDKWYSCLAPTMVDSGDWAPGEDKQLAAALATALETGPEWEIDWGDLVLGRSMEQCKRRWRVIQQYLPIEQRRSFKAAVAAACVLLKRSARGSSSKGSQEKKKSREAAAAQSS